MPSIDLDMLAVDIAKLLDRYSYEIDASADDIRPHLDDFVARVQETAAQNAEQELGDDAAVWWADQAGAENAEPTPQSSRRPRMTYLEWMRSQLVMIGATAVDEHYWQCPTTGCKVWAGSYLNPIAAKNAGFQHVYKCEKTDYFRRDQQAWAATSLIAMRERQS